MLSNDLNSAFNKYSNSLRDRIEIVEAFSLFATSERMQQIIERKKSEIWNMFSVECQNIKREFDLKNLK